MVRHSERLDEVAPQEWKRIYKQDKSARDKYSFASDPPITENGRIIATSAGMTVKALVDSIMTSSDRSINLQEHYNAILAAAAQTSQNAQESQNSVIPHTFAKSSALQGTTTAMQKKRLLLYSSRLTRCVQTAYEIAKVLNHAEIRVSSGLALTAAAVAQGGFEFRTTADLQSVHDKCFPAVRLVDCDHGDGGIDGRCGSDSDTSYDSQEGDFEDWLHNQNDGGHAGGGGGGGDARMQTFTNQDDTALAAASSAPAAASRETIDLDDVCTLRDKEREVKVAMEGTSVASWSNNSKKKSERRGNNSKLLSAKDNDDEEEVFVSSDDWFGAIDSIMYPRRKQQPLQLPLPPSPPAQVRTPPSYTEMVATVSQDITGDKDNGVNQEEDDDIIVLVAHRETIRNLCRQTMRLPYCAIGLFSHITHVQSGKKEIIPLKILDKDGNTIMDCFSALCSSSKL